MSPLTIPSRQSDESPSTIHRPSDVKGKEKVDENDASSDYDGAKREPIDSVGGQDIEMGPTNVVERRKVSGGVFPIHPFHWQRDRLKFITSISGLWAGAYEPLIPGTILDTRRYAGKFSQRVRFNDIDHILMKKFIPGTHRIIEVDLGAGAVRLILLAAQHCFLTLGKSVSLTKGRISIVWEGVNTFSDHYGKRLTLNFNVGKLLAKWEGGGARQDRV